MLFEFITNIYEIPKKKLTYVIIRINPLLKNINVEIANEKWSFWPFNLLWVKSQFSIANQNVCQENQWFSNQISVAKTKYSFKDFTWPISRSIVISYENKKRFMSMYGHGIRQPKGVFIKAELVARHLCLRIKHFENV